MSSLAGVNSIYTYNCVEKYSVKYYQKQQILKTRMNKLKLYRKIPPENQKYVSNDYVSMPVWVGV